MVNCFFTWPIRIYYEDTDAEGVVYHARYLAFYERARTELLRKHSISQQKLLSEHVAFAVRRLSIEYIAPAYLDSLLVVKTRITRVKGASIIFEQRIENEQGCCINSAEVRIACIELTLMKPIALPSFIVAELCCD